MIRSGLALLCLPALAGLALAAPAGAYVTTPTVESSTTFGTSPIFQSTSCSPDDSVIGGGGALFTPKNVGKTAAKAVDSDVGFNVLALFPPANGYFAGATAVKGNPFVGLTSYAFCANTDASPPQDGDGYVRGLEIIHTQSAYDSTDRKSIKATCPANKILIGGGGGDVDAPVAILIDKAAPSDRTWIVHAHEARPTDQGWQVEAKAICASVTDTSTKDNYVDNVQAISTESPPGSKTIQKAVLTCPPGLKVIGGGGGVISGGGPPPREVVLTRNQPRSDDKTDDQWATEGTEVVPTDAEWGILTFALCANLKGSATPPT